MQSDMRSTTHNNGRGFCHGISRLPQHVNTNTTTRTQDNTTGTQHSQQGLLGSSDWRARSPLWFVVSHVASFLPFFFNTLYAMCTHSFTDSEPACRSARCRLAHSLSDVFFVISCTTASIVISCLGPSVIAGQLFRRTKSFLR
jgi:hypothetical protein